MLHWNERLVLVAAVVGYSTGCVLLLITKMSHWVIFWRQAVGGCGKRFYERSLRMKNTSF